MSINHRAWVKKARLLLKHTSRFTCPPAQKYRPKQDPFQYMLSLHFAWTLAAVCSWTGACLASWQASPFLWPFQGIRAAKSVVHSSVFMVYSLTLLIQTHIPCVTHFAYFPQQHIARTLMSKANSVQIPFRNYFCWQNQLPPLNLWEICRTGYFSYLCCSAPPATPLPSVTRPAASHWFATCCCEQTAQLFTTSSAAKVKIEQ